MRVADAYGDVIELEQGWTDDTQQAFYNTPQGAEILPYSWILALEQKDSEKAFLDPANIERFRYLPRKKTDSNPDGLPVGWTKGSDATGKVWLGLTCAACHTGQVEYTNPQTQQKIGIRVDGAPTLADFNTMNLELVAAMKATLTDEAKFDRFAKAVMKDGDSPNARSGLRGDLQAQTAMLNARNEINKAHIEYGFARIDAIGFIFNQTMSTLPGIPENAKPSDAPASYPFLWGTDQSDVVQWTGFAANSSGAGTLVRNGGEVIGVYGKVALTEATEYESSFMIDNLGKLENWVRELNSPAWPELVFPAIDRAKAAQGEKLYADACAQCHQVIARDVAIKTAYVAAITPVEELGTDPTELANMNERKYKAGIYNGKKVGSIAGPVIGGPQNNGLTTGLNPLVNAVVGSLLKHKLEAVKAFADEYATRTSSAPTSAPGYKGRPLNGIWATAPYLHNGSVPNLYELLLPAAQRSKTFTLGSRAYDPVRVGYALDQPKAAEDYTPFTFDVSPKGNWNTGHEYLMTQEGVPFTEEQRWQIVEYMKTL
ncbi:di-heme-cytochrome C peroxidase [Hyalangium sp.]|uniref:di-heme-cytochrome C peroxidase n=1 Tax=Hyalangium sp. TaxID=2028555 RepID=UPI002D257D4D|nr:di-heme-cytochrome C peroxidase [Hyalangium sp.]HYH97936.1 di-heme-cytochrome C peroxidase [Hyalangium sp.]